MYRFLQTAFIRKTHRSFGRNWNIWAIHMVSLNIMQMMMTTSMIL